MAKPRGHPGAPRTFPPVPPHILAGLCMPTTVTSDRMGKEFLQGLRQVSGCSSRGFGPRLEEAAGREGASVCPLAPRPKS